MPKSTSSIFSTHIDAADVGSSAISVLVQGISFGPEQSEILGGSLQIRMKTAVDP